MPTTKICPRCKQLPNIRESHSFLQYSCTIYCHNIGCKYFYPVVGVAFSKQKAMDKAVKLWNERIEN